MSLSWQLSNVSRQRSSFKTREFNLALYTDPFICWFYTTVSKPICLTVRHRLGSSFLHCLLLLYPGRQSRSAPSVEEGIALSHPSSLTRERERTLRHVWGIKQVHQATFAPWVRCVCRVGALPGVGGFREGHDVEVGSQCAAFSSFGGAREWPPTPSVSWR